MSDLLNNGLQHNEIFARVKETALDKIKREIAEAENITWDYRGYKQHDSITNQLDWSQTLITKINQLSAQIHKSTLRGGANKLTVDPRLEELFKILEYYHESDINKTLGGRFVVVYDSNVGPNTIKIERTHEKDIWNDSILIPSTIEDGVDFNPELMEQSLRFYKISENQEFVDRYTDKSTRFLKVSNLTDEDLEIIKRERIIREKNEEGNISKYHLIASIGYDEEKSEQLFKSNYLNTPNDEIEPITKDNNLSNKEILEHYKSTFNSPVGMLFYFNKISDGVTSNTLLKGRLMMKSVIINLNDISGTLDKMDEISNNSRFVKWAGDFQPTDKNVYKHVWDRDIYNQSPKVESTEKDYSFMFNSKKETINEDPIQIEYLDSRKHKILKVRWVPELANDITTYQHIEPKHELLEIYKEQLNKELTKDEFIQIADAISIDELIMGMENAGYKLSPQMFSSDTFTPYKQWFKDNVPHLM